MEEQNFTFYMFGITINLINVHMYVLYIEAKFDHHLWTVQLLHVLP